MKLTISDIINKHKDKPCLVLGHGPSLNLIKDKLSEYKKKGFILIATNDWYSFYDVVPHYSVVCNHQYSISRQYKEINKYCVPYVYSDVQDLTCRPRVDELLTVDYLPYDFRHFNNKKCDGHPKWSYPCEVANCCNHFLINRLTIQEEIKKYTRYNEVCSQGDVNVLRQLMFGILMGCNPIYMAGIDFDYRQGYAKSSNTITQIKVDEYQTDIKLQQSIHNDFRILNESTKNINVKIINTNHNLIYNEFEKSNIK